jgi:hypothetical protein
MFLIVLLSVSLTTAFMVAMGAPLVPTLIGALIGGVGMGLILSLASR